MALRYVIIDDTAFVFDSGTVKLFRMDGEERVEISDPATRARVLAYGSTVGEEAARELALSQDFAARAQWSGL